MTSTTKETKATTKRKPAEEIGIVASDKMQKTIVVALIRRVKHAKYGKYFTKTKRVKAHDEKNEAKIGDQVLIVESRPLSKDKRYALKQILRKA